MNKNIIYEYKTHSLVFSITYDDLIITSKFRVSILGLLLALNLKFFYGVNSIYLIEDVEFSDSQWK